MRLTLVHPAIGRKPMRTARVRAPPRRPRSRIAFTCASMWPRPWRRCAVRMARCSRRSMRRGVRPPSATPMALWLSPSPRHPPRRRLRNSPPSAGRDGWPAMSRCGRCATRGGRARRSPGSWAWVGRRCFATSMRRPFLNGRGALIAARVSSILIRTTWSSAGMRAAVTPASCVRNSVNVAIAAVILPSPAIPSACARPRGWHLASACSASPWWPSVTPSSRRSRPVVRHGWWCDVRTSVRRSSPSSSPSCAPSRVNWRRPSP